jgi:hypothetical protein
MGTQVKVPSGSKPGSNFPPVEVFEIGTPGKPGELIIHNGKLYIYNENGETLIDGGIIQAAAILANSITADKLTIGSKSFSHNLTWTATDQDTASWSAGTIKLADDETTAINAGNTGNINYTTFIYFDGTSVLKTTTNYANAVGDSKILLAIVEKGQLGGGCAITPIQSAGTTIDANKIVTGKVQSVDGQTYFDLNLGRMIINDDSNDIILIGKKP